MVLGDSMSVMLELEVDISQLAKLKAARQAINKFQADAQRGSRSMNASLNRSASNMRNVATASEVASKKVSGVGRAAIYTSESASSGFTTMRSSALRAKGGIGSLKNSIAGGISKIAGMTGKIQAMRVAMLNLMFTGMNLAFIFGGILALSPRIRAGFSAIAGALRLIAIEAGKMALPALLKFAKYIRNLSEGTKEAIALVLLIGTVLGAAGVIIGSIGGAVLTLINIFIRLAQVGYFLITSLAGLLPSLGAVSAAFSGLLLPILAIVAAVGVLVAAFLEFEVVRKAVANGIGFLYEVFMNIGNLMVYLSETALNQLILGFLRLKKWVETTEDSILRFANSIIKQAVGAINDLIAGINNLAEKDKTGLIPTLDKINTENFQFNVDTSNIDKLNKKIREFRRRQRQANSDFGERLKMNDKKARNLSSSIKNLVNANKDQKLGGMIGGLFSGLFGGLLGGKNVSQRGVQTMSDVREMKKVEKNVENNYTVQNAELQDGMDVEQLMQEFEERQERNQRRQKNTL